MCAGTCINNRYKMTCTLSGVFVRGVRLCEFIIDKYVSVLKHFTSILSATLDSMISLFFICRCVLKFYIHITLPFANSCSTFLCLGVTITYPKFLTVEVFNICNDYNSDILANSTHFTCLSFAVLCGTICPFLGLPSLPTCLTVNLEVMSVIGCYTGRLLYFCGVAITLTVWRPIILTLITPACPVSGSADVHTGFSLGMFVSYLRGDYCALCLVTYRRDIRYTIVRYCQLSSYHSTLCTSDFNMTIIIQLAP